MQRRKRSQGEFSQAEEPVYREEYLGEYAVDTPEEEEEQEEPGISKYVLGILGGMALLVFLLILLVSLIQWLKSDMKSALVFLENGLK